MTRRGRTTRLSAEDRKLWRLVTETVSPLRPMAEDVATPDDDKPAEPAKQAAGSKSEKPAQPAPPKAVRKTPRLAPLEPRLLRRLGRGAMSAEAVLDLHGLTQQEAHGRLIAFLNHSRAAGRRIVLIVTGKGRKEDAGDWWEAGPRGVLRRAVPRWLAEPELRRLVVGYQQAHDRKGGEGAIYVQLRRIRPEGTGRP